tara:strand:- start:243 stop:677 length:435 start_codon:yes stop_codon:yes gene_type:complete
MKTFREHLAEHSGHFSRQWLDQDTIPSAPHALEALNSLIGQMAEQEYLNPQVGIEKLQSGLGKLGYHFESPTLDGGEGEYSIPLSYGAGTFEADMSQNPYGEFKEGDGISDHIEGGVSLQIDVMPSGNGKTIMNAELVRNTDKG